MGGIEPPSVVLETIMLPLHHTRVFYFLASTLVTVYVAQVVSFTTVSVSDTEGVVLTVPLELQETANIDAIIIAAKTVFFIFSAFVGLFGSQRQQKIKV